MSNTDRTRPYWVRVQDDLSITEESHACAKAAYVSFWVRTNPEHACDIDTGPRSLCRRSFITDFETYSSAPKNNYIREHWTCPDRRRARDECRDAARDFNANGDTDVIVSTDPHRHEGLWWWW